MNMKSGCYIPKLKEKYINEVIPEFKKNFGITNTMSVPKLVKICINQGVGFAGGDKKAFG